MGVPSPQSTTCDCARIAGVDELADHGRDYVAGLEIEVVTGSIEVHRKQRDDRGAVLLAIGLRLHDEHALGEAIRRVGLFGVPVPQVTLGERHRRVLRIRAHGPRHEHLGHLSDPTRFEQLDAHARVLVEEPAWLGAVRADAADYRCEVHHRIGAVAVEQPIDLFPIREVAVGAPQAHDVGTGRAELGHHVTTEEACSTRHHDPSVPGLEQLMPPTPRGRARRYLSIMQRGTRA